MVYVAHYGNDRRAWHEVVFVVGLLGYGFRHFCADVFRGEAELLGNEVYGLCVEALVD